MNEKFRLAKQHAPTAQDEANRNIAAIVDPLGPQQLQLFTRKTIIDNLLASVDRGEPLRFGFKDREEVAEYQDKLDRLVDATPEVQKALERRREIVNEIVDKLIALKLLPEEAKNRADTYYHQQVLQYFQSVRLGRNPQITKKGFQKQRIEGVEQFDESLNYNTSYLEAEYEWMRDAYHQIAKEEWLRDLAERFDKKGEFQEAARKLDTDWRDLVAQSKTHRLWQATPGNQFYQAVGVAEHVIEEVMQGIASEVEITRDDVRNVLAMGGRQREMVLPNELVDQLESMKAPKLGGDTFGDAMAWLSKEIIKAWRTWTLFQPMRALAYNLRNITGDLDPVIGGALGSVKYTSRALRDLSGYYGILRTGIKPKLFLTPELSEARDLAVFDASMTASEIPDIKDLAIFKRFYTADKKNLPGLVKDYFDTVKRYSTFRESISRYAAYLYYKDALEKGTLAHYGGASKSTVDALAKEMGIPVAAAHLARNLLGDYQDITVAGSFLREHVAPFWSWQEINLKRTPQLFWNAALYGPRKVEKLGLKGGVKATAAVSLSGAAIGLASLPYVIQQLYNRLAWPDEEDQLSDSERASPHIIWGRNADGTIRILRNTGATGDFLEWFGVNTAIARLDELKAKQMTHVQLAKEIGRDIFSKVIEGVRPDAKAVYEVPTGTSLYPNPAVPRSTRRDELVAGYVGLTDVYREARGRVTKDGSRARPNMLARTFGVTDPRKNALFEIIELRDRYLGKLGHDKQHRGNEYFTNMREAASNGDPKAFTEARTAYLNKGGDYERFKRAIAALDPISQRLADDKEHEFEHEYLTVEQREKLHRARDYARELEVSMWTLWKESEKSDPKDVALRLMKPFLNDLARPRPLSVPKELRQKGVTFKQHIEEYNAKVAEAKAYLKRHGITKGEALSAFEEEIADLEPANKARRRGALLSRLKSTGEK